MQSALGTLLEQRAAEVGDRPFIVMAGGVRLTFAEFNERVNNVAHGLAGAGVTQGDRVAIMLGNSVEFLLASYALKKLGAVEVAVNTGFRGPGLAHVVSLTEARLLITEDEFVPPLAAVLGELPQLRTVVLVDAEPTERRAALPGLDLGHFRDLVTNRGDNPGTLVRAGDLATVLFTSGTTGASKGCMLPHRYGVVTGQVISRSIGLRADDCLYAPFPLYHVDAAFLTVAPALVLGACAAIGRRFSASRFWDEVREFEATVFDFMGATLTILWKRHPLPDDGDNPVRLAWGVPMPNWRRGFEERFGLRLVHAYGLTDGGMPCWEDPDEDEPHGSCGKAQPPYELRIVDESDYEVEAGVVGEILIRPLEPDVTMQGYWGMPEATLRAFRNLWLHTGDLGRLDTDGHLFFEGRKKDAIRRRGENISAWEIEEVLQSHPAVAEAVAIGVPSDLTEEDVKVCIVLRAGESMTAEEVRDYCRPRMARFMVPEHVELLDEIPKTPTGKPEKYKLIARHVEATRTGVAGSSVDLGTVPY